MTAEWGDFAGLLGELDVVFVAPAIEMDCHCLSLAVGFDDLSHAPVVDLVTSVNILMKTKQIRRLAYLVCRQRVVAQLEPLG